jgi:hypothetical protein
MPDDVCAIIGGVDVEGWFSATAADRPVFHSEADLQHHLAWTIRDLEPDVQVRLETRPQLGRRRSMDVLLVDRRSGERLGIELKYPTRALVTTWGGEAFTLLNQSAQDITRYDICTDVRRLGASATSLPARAGHSARWSYPSGVRTSLRRHRHASRSVRRES